MEKTLILLKPDAVQRNLSGEIIKILEQTGYKIIGIKFMILPLEKANDHYSEHKDKPFFNDLVEFMTSGPNLSIESVKCLSRMEAPNATAPSDTLIPLSCPE